MISGINTRCSVKAPGCSTVTDPGLMAARGWAPTCSYETEVREISHWSATTHCGDIASRIDACLLLGWHGWGCCWCSCYRGGGCYRLLCCTSGNQDRCYDRQQNKKQSWFFHSIITLKGNELSFKSVKIIFAFHFLLVCRRLYRRAWPSCHTPVPRQILLFSLESVVKWGDPVSASRTGQRSIVEEGSTSMSVTSRKNHYSAVQQWQIAATRENLKAAKAFVNKTSLFNGT